MARKRKREAVSFLNDHMKMAAETLSARDCGRLFEAVRLYSMEDVEPDLDKESRIYRSIFSMMRSAQDRMIERYEETCERNRQRVMKRWQQEGDGGDTGGKQRYTENTKQNETRRDETRQDEKKQSETSDDPSLAGQEIKGVPGVVWA